MDTNAAIVANCVALLCAAFVVLLLLASTVRILPEYRRLVIFRLGRLVRVGGPGIVFVLPFIDRGVAVDLREQLIELKRTAAVTQDNSAVTLDLACRYKVTDTIRSLTAVQNARAALSQAGLTAVREVIAGLSLYEFLQDQGEIRAAVEERLRHVSQPWGLEIAGAELHNLNRTG